MTIGEVIALIKAFGGGGGGSSGGGVLVVHMNIDMQTRTITLDKTWKEIKDADFAVAEFPVMANNGNYAKRLFASIKKGTSGEEFVPWSVQFDDATLSEFTTDNENGYPSLQM